MTNNVDVPYPLSSDVNGDRIKATYRPGREGFNREWRQKKIDQWKHYLLLDPLTQNNMVLPTNEMNV